MFVRTILSCCLLVLLSIPAHAYNQLPGKGVTIKPARATWVSGYFHETIIRKGLEELGYSVKKPKDLSPAIFYKVVSLGDIDYWPNTWLPNQNHLLSDAVKEKTSQIGYVLKDEGLQGYLVSKSYAEKFDIKSLDDFKRPEVVKAFDHDNDGKADLTGCPSGWACAKIINRHLKENGLKKYVRHIQASYEAAMASNLGAYKSGEPIFYYAWTPSWTVFKLKPGKDVVWINVPEKYNTPSEKPLENVVGAVSSPINMGFEVASIRVTANNKFLEANPAAKKFFTLFRMSVGDMNAQQVKVQEGKKSQKDINNQADEWIAANKALWDSWLDQARQAAN